MGGRSAEKRAELERKRQRALENVQQRLEADSSCADDPVIQRVRAMGECGEQLFPVIPRDVYRGVDVEFSDQGREFDPRRVSGKAGVVYWNAGRRAAAANEVALRIAAGETLRKICGPGRDRSMLPEKGTYLAWIFGLGDEYVQMTYDLARRMRAEGYADELIEIADAGMDAADIAQVQGFRLAMEARQWVTERILPRLYGRKGDGSSGVTINVNTNLGGADEVGDDGTYRVSISASGE